MKKLFKNIGPATLVTAAFIGPGTVTVCTLAGVNFGHALLWAMVLSVIATIVLQEMAARLGIISQRGLSEVIRTQIKHPTVRTLAIILILSAIVIGNAAYEAGNISGGVLGLETVLGESALYPSVIGIIAFVLLFIGNYKVLERALVTLVIIMSISFLITAIMTKPDLASVLKGMFVPTFPAESILTIIALIGTTVVPYNLFLHASLVKEKWNTAEDLSHARKDTFIAVILGGIVSMAIITSAASINLTDVSNAADLAKGLEPLFGSYAKYFLAIGLFAAGITSAITAPLAAAYVANGCLGWKASLKSWKFRSVWIGILLLGVLFSSFGIKSIEIIKFAQVANGILLPVIAGFLLWVMNNKEVLGKYRNSVRHNIFGFAILAIAIFLGAKSILKVFAII